MLLEFWDGYILKVLESFTRVVIVGRAMSVHLRTHRGVSSKEVPCHVYMYTFEYVHRTPICAVSSKSLEVTRKPAEENVSAKERHQTDG